MGKRDVERKVAEAMKSLTESKEASVRELAEVLDEVAGLDAKLVALNATRTTAVGRAGEALEAAKSAGWKVAELRSAGFVVPQTITLGIESPSGAGSE